MKKIIASLVLLLGFVTLSFAGPAVPDLNNDIVEAVAKEKSLTPDQCDQVKAALVEFATGAKEVNQKYKGDTDGRKAASQELATKVSQKLDEQTGVKGLGKIVLKKRADLIKASK